MIFLKHVKNPKILNPSFQIHRDRSDDISIFLLVLVLHLAKEGLNLGIEK